VKLTVHVLVFCFQGYFFHDHGSVQDSDREDLLSDTPSLSATTDPPYRKIHTTWTAGLEIVVIVRPSSNSKDDAI
jgi:hypothetical protein